jgi:hypothetical protein
MLNIPVGRLGRGGERLWNMRCFSDESAEHIEIHRLVTVAYLARYNVKHEPIDSD